VTKHTSSNTPQNAWRGFFALQFLEDGLGILTKETHERVFQRMFRFTVMAVLIIEIQSIVSP
jgi:hypothetical protein